MKFVNEAHSPLDTVNIFTIYYWQGWLKRSPPTPHPYWLGALKSLLPVIYFQNQLTCNPTKTLYDFFIIFLLFFCGQEKHPTGFMNVLHWELSQWMFYPQKCQQERVQGGRNPEAVENVGRKVTKCTFWSDNGSDQDGQWLFLSGFVYLNVLKIEYQILRILLPPNITYACIKANQF